MDKVELSVARGLRVRSSVKAGKTGGGGGGYESEQHNQTVARNLKVRTKVNAGIEGMPHNHNQTVARGMKVKTNIKAGNPPPSTDPSDGSTG